MLISYLYIFQNRRIGDHKDITEGNVIALYVLTKFYHWYLYGVPRPPGVIPEHRSGISSKTTRCGPTNPKPKQIKIEE